MSKNPAVERPSDLFLAQPDLPRCPSGRAAAAPTPSHSSVLGDRLGQSSAVGDLVRHALVSPENPTGEKGGGCARRPHGESRSSLRRSRPRTWAKAGRSVRFLSPRRARRSRSWMWLDPGSSSTSGWQLRRTGLGNGRACVLRFYWDDETITVGRGPAHRFLRRRPRPVRARKVAGRGGESHVSAECLLADAISQARPRLLSPTSRENDLSLFTYQITYALSSGAPKAGYFHAQWRRSLTPAQQVLCILFWIPCEGEGRYVGTFLAWTQLSEGWFGEGEIKFFLDGDRDFPTICGTGTEDYFGGELWIARGLHRTVYRQYAARPTARMDPASGVFIAGISWTQSASSATSAFHPGFGFACRRTLRPLADDVASLAYWYQREPHTPVPAVSQPRQALATLVCQYRSLDFGQVFEPRVHQRQLLLWDDANADQFLIAGAQVLRDAIPSRPQTSTDSSASRSFDFARYPGTSSSKSRSILCGFAAGPLREHEIPVRIPFPTGSAAPQSFARCRSSGMSSSWASREADRPAATTMWSDC